MPTPPHDGQASAVEIEGMRLPDGLTEDDLETAANWVTLWANSEHRDDWPEELCREAGITDRDSLYSPMPVVLQIANLFAQRLRS